MQPDSYRRRRWTYSFRAWIDERGSNEDRAHERYCVCSPDHRRHGTHYVGVHQCPHLRLWDLNLTSDSRNIIRVVRWPLRVYVGRKLRRVA